MVVSRVQQTCGPCAEKAVEVLGKGRGGTSLGLAIRGRRLEASRCRSGATRAGATPRSERSGAGVPSSVGGASTSREWTHTEGHDGGAIFETNPKRGSGMGEGSLRQEGARAERGRGAEDFGPRRISGIDRHSTARRRDVCEGEAKARGAYPPAARSRARRDGRATKTSRRARAPGPRSGWSAGKANDPHRRGGRPRSSGALDARPRRSPSPSPARAGPHGSSLGPSAMAHTSAGGVPDASLRCHPPPGPSGSGGGRRWVPPSAPPSSASPAIERGRRPQKLSAARSRSLSPSTRPSSRQTRACSRSAASCSPQLSGRK